MQNYIVSQSIPAKQIVTEVRVDGDCLKLSPGAKVALEDADAAKVLKLYPGIISPLSFDGSSEPTPSGKSKGPGEGSPKVVVKN